MPAYGTWLDNEVLDELALEPGAVPAEATEDAAPDVAQPRSARRTAAANAMNSFSSDCFSVANDQARFARF